MRRRRFLVTTGASATATMAGYIGRSQDEARSDADSASLEVEVVSSAGDPVADATVTVGGETVETDENGIATIDLEEGTYTIEAVAAAYLPEEREVTVDGDESVVVVLEREYAGVEITGWTIDVTRREAAEDTIDATVVVENRGDHDSGRVWVDVYVYDEDGDELGVESSRNVSVSTGGREELRVTVARSSGESFPANLGVGSAVIRVDSIESQGWIDEVRTGDAPAEPERPAVDEEPIDEEPVVDDVTTVNLDREYGAIEILDHDVGITRRETAEDTIDATVTVENRGRTDSGKMWVDIYVYDESGDELGFEGSRSFSLAPGDREELGVTVARSESVAFEDDLAIGASVIRLDSIESPDRIDEVRTGDAPAEPERPAVDEEPIDEEPVVDDDTTVNLDREYGAIEILDHDVGITRRETAEDTIDATVAVENRGRTDSGSLWVDVTVYDESGDELGFEGSRSFSLAPGDSEELGVTVTRSEYANFPADLTIGSYELVLDSIESPDRIDEATGETGSFAARLPELFG